MDYLKIGSKEYPFIVSANTAKNYFTKGEAAKESMSEGIDVQLDLIYNGLEDGSLSMSWIERNITKRLPSKERVSRLVTISEMNKAISLIFPVSDKVEGEIETEGKK
tara:strand:- start:632 stop:952 length:321 start_codon:yes stop_codon:yes gene_type:complete